MNARAKWAYVAVWGTFFAVIAIGCNPITTTAFLLRDEGKIPTEMPLRPHLATNGEAKEEVKLIVLCSIPGNSPMAFAGVDRQIATLITKKFPELYLANGSKERVKIVPAATVDKFQASHPESRYMNPGDLGRQLGADYVLDITLSALQIYEPGSANQVYQGRADVNVDVYDCTRRSKDKFYTYVHPFTYPQGMVRDASAIPLDRFKMEFMHKLASELVLKHIDHKPSEGIAAASVR